jgi:hypothetical protein
MIFTCMPCRERYAPCISHAVLPAVRKDSRKTIDCFDSPARCESGTLSIHRTGYYGMPPVLANKVTCFESEESVEANNHVLRPCRGGGRNSVSELWVVARRTHAGEGIRIRVPRLWQRVRPAADRIELETGELTTARSAHELGPIPLSSVVRR